MHVILVVLPPPLYLRMHLLHLIPPLTLSLSTSHLISPAAYIPLRYYWLNPTCYISSCLICIFYHFASTTLSSRQHSFDTQSDSGNPPLNPSTKWSCLTYRLRSSSASSQSMRPRSVSAKHGSTEKSAVSMTTLALRHH
jgi:hypothetical protein